MLSRKRFIRQAALSAGAMLAGPSIVNAAEYFSPLKLTILHTNDTHSRLEPFPMDGGRNQGLGGIAARAQLITEIRQQEEQVLLFDAGDIFQGTPYFNLYKGEPEIKAMSSMKYDATTIGNHDFDAGMENLATQLSRHANFPMLIANYDFTGTPMEYKTQPYKIFKKGKLKIGVFGVGIEGRGLIPDSLFGATKYLDPISKANEVAGKLKADEKCDMIICLSHLGYKYKESNIVSDEVLAKETENVDLIIGGHTHTFLDDPIVYKNKKGDDVIVNQVGFAGIILGRLDFEFSKFSGKKLTKNHNISVSQKTGG
ncbi:MAG: metallophosphatase [Chitinophagaceae bacterium]|nr:metallophosphatase [Chitinophagaceae bacterium]MBK9463761.1 metallophosphatase [Chitinophagaceae bacterium]MBK9659122.1 metallophosphatase [Chitinophagaceae bacterium]MBP6233597.1 metallophosphatase [Chitinophagaceae bacterium]MBP6415629.1 metallophosphatase [Chitinophagaceae bacterium]